MCLSLNTKQLQTVQTEQAPLQSRHSSAIYTQFPGLFAKMDAVYNEYKKKKSDATDLSPEQTRLMERIHRDFCRAGAALSQEKEG